MLYGTVIWVLAGLFQAQWWVQFACFVLSVLLVMRINSKNLLIRIYSRSVSVAFIFLSCAAVFLFPSWTGGLVQLCCIAALMLLFDSYQDQTAVGKAYYAFLLLGISSMFDAHVIFYLPLLWIMMKVIVYALSWRTFFASLLGLATPYWFMIGWLMWQKNGDLQAIVSLFSVQESQKNRGQTDSEQTDEYGCEIPHCQIQGQTQIFIGKSEGVGELSQKK